MEYSILPAIVIVGYKRTDSIFRLYQSIVNARYPSEDIHIVVSLDQSENTDEIIDRIQSLDWKHGDLEFRVNNPGLGLKEHILQCGSYSSEYGAVIILEDDLLVSPNYYVYACEALNKYADSDDIAGISLYSHSWSGYSQSHFIPQNNGFDTYFGQFSITWGPCWTAKQWSCFIKWYDEHTLLSEENLDLPRKIDSWGDNSWGRYFAKYIVSEGKYYVIPYVSHLTNFSETGEHCKQSNAVFQVQLENFIESKNYVFPDFKQGIKYDMFFERVPDESMCIAGIDGREICFDLNGIRRTNMGKKYVLTMEKLKGFKTLCSYGILMRPIENNVIYGCPGNDIFLYELPEEKVFLSHKRNLHRAVYEMYGADWRTTLSYTIIRIIQLINYVIRER